MPPETRKKTGNTTKEVDEVKFDVPKRPREAGAISRRAVVEGSEAGTESLATPEEHNPFDCDDADWNRYLTHGSDQSNLDTNLWGKQIDACGCGEVPITGPLYGDLEATVHSIFAADNWPLENFTKAQGKRSKTWKMLEPALQLATNFLLSKPALAFFRQVSFGKETLDSESGRTYLKYHEPIDTSEQDATVHQDLEDLADRIKIVFCAFSEEVGEDAQTHAMHVTSRELFGKKMFIRGDVSKLPSVEDDSHYMMVNAAYKVYAESVVPTHCAFARFAFSLAFSVVHEIAHAYYVRDKDHCPETYDEPHFSLEQYNEVDELGFALETALFGDILKTFMHPVEGVQAQWEPVVKRMLGTRVVSIDGHLVFPVDPRWLRRFLTQSFWDSLDKLRGKKAREAFFIPQADEGLVLTHPERETRWGMRQAVLDRKREEEKEEKKMKKKGKKKQSTGAWQSVGKKRKRSPLDDVEVIENFETLNEKLLTEEVERLRSEAGEYDAISKSNGGDDVVEGPKTRSKRKRLDFDGIVEGIKSSSAKKTTKSGRKGH